MDGGIVDGDGVTDGWRAGRRHRDWLNPPARVVREQDDLLVTATEGSDLWRTTSYGFVPDTGHALLADPDGTAAEVTFVPDVTAQPDQAGLLVRGDEEQWSRPVSSCPTACCSSAPSSREACRTGPSLRCRSRRARPSSCGRAGPARR